jgi:hypothetical protein
MFPSNPSEIEESNAPFYAVWQTIARKFACNQTSESPGVSISWAGAEWPILKVVGLSGPVVDHADLDAKVQQAVGFTKNRPVIPAGRSFPGLLSSSDRKWNEQPRVTTVSSATEHWLRR